MTPSLAALCIDLGLYLRAVAGEHKLYAASGVSETSCSDPARYGGYAVLCRLHYKALLIDCVHLEWWNFLLLFTYVNNRLAESGLRFMRKKGIYKNEKCLSA